MSWPATWRSASKPNLNRIGTVISEGEGRNGQEEPQAEEEKEEEEKTR
jgi:hypothetical protein